MQLHNSKKRNFQDFFWKHRMTFFANNILFKSNKYLAIYCTTNMQQYFV